MRALGYLAKRCIKKYVPAQVTRPAANAIAMVMVALAPVCGSAATVAIEATGPAAPAIGLYISFLSTVVGLFPTTVYISIIHQI